MQDPDYLPDDFGPDEAGNWPPIDPEPYPVRVREPALKCSSH